MSNPINWVEAAVLLQGGEKGYRKLFTRIWEYYYPRLIVYIRNNRLSDSGDDIVQEILTKVWMNLASYNPVYSLSTWIYTIARNHIRDLHRKKKLSSTSLNTVGTTLFIDTKNLSPEDNYFRQRKKRHISRFIDSLDESNREIAYLRFYEHIKIKHIAVIMKMPVGTIKYRISIIKQKLSAYLEDDYGEEGN